MSQSPIRSPKEPTHERLLADLLRVREAVAHLDENRARLLEAERALEAAIEATKRIPI